MICGGGSMQDFINHSFPNLEEARAFLAQEIPKTAERVRQAFERDGRVVRNAVCELEKTGDELELTDHVFNQEFYGVKIAFDGYDACFGRLLIFQWDSPGRKKPKKATSPPVSNRIQSTRTRWRGSTVSSRPSTQEGHG
jgi:hypothetical protein